MRRACRPCPGRAAIVPRRSRAQSRAPGARTRTRRSAARRSFRGAKVVEARPVLHRHAVGAMHYELGIARVDGADARKRKLQFRGQRSDRLAPAGIGGEDELVVIAAGEHAVALERAVALILGYGAQRRRTRNALIVERGADLRALEDVAEIAGKAVGDVDRGMREPAQALAELDARLRLVQPARRFFNFGMF